VLNIGYADYSKGDLWVLDFYIAVAQWTLENEKA